MTRPDDLPRIMRQSEPAIAEDFMAYVAGTLEATDWDEFLSAMERGDFASAANLIEWADYTPEAGIVAAFGAAAVHQSKYISEIAKVKYAFDLKNPNALKWIEEHGAELVKQVDPGTKAALREVIYRGYFSGYTPQAQTEYIRGLVGLDERRAGAVDNLVRKLTERGRDPAEIQRKAEKYSAKLLQQRAKTIAVNEASEASSRGQYLSTQDACHRGILDTRKYEAFRIVTPDDRLCDICAALDGETRMLSDGVYHSSGETIPKLHVCCRCVEGLREIMIREGAKMKAKTREKADVKADILFEAKGLKETDTSLFVPTVPMVEGVFMGHGFPTLRLFEEFGPYARWFDGLPVVPNHESLDPDVRRIGQMKDPAAEDGKRRVKAKTEFFKSDITPNEMERLKSGEPTHGSLSYSCYMDYTAGEHNGVQYDAIERGPYVFHEYSLVRSGIVTPEDGAGFNLECSACGAKHESQSPAHRAETGESKMGDGNDPGHEPGITEESVKTQISEAVEAAEKRMEAKYQARIDALEAEKKARDLVEFSRRLKKGHQEKAAELLEALQKDPVKWLEENADKLFVAVESQGTKGSPVIEDGKSTALDHQAEMRKIYEGA